MEVQVKPKAEGIRIRHGSMKSCLLVVRDKSRPFDKPDNFEFPICSECYVPHDCKTYHLLLDDEGTVIVSQGVFDALSNLDDRGGFEVSNRVTNPPTQTLRVPLVKELIMPFDFGKELK